MEESARSHRVYYRNPIHSEETIRHTARNEKQKLNRTVRQLDLAKRAQDIFYRTNGSNMNPNGSKVRKVANATLNDPFVRKANSNIAGAHQMDVDEATYSLPLSWNETGHGQNPPGDVYLYKRREALAAKEIRKDRLHAATKRDSNRRVAKQQGVKRATANVIVDKSKRTLSKAK